jgi:hypothetical protein
MMSDYLQPYDRNRMLVILHMTIAAAGGAGFLGTITGGFAIGFVCACYGSLLGLSTGALVTAFVKAAEAGNTRKPAESGSAR